MDPYSEVIPVNLSAVWRDLSYVLEDAYKYVINGKGSIKTKKGKPIKGNVNPHGYHRVVLSAGGIKKGFQIHRLVALSFLVNTENKEIVNHKNGDKTDNTLFNLEWASSSENAYHFHDILKTKEKTKKVIQYSKTGKLIKIHESLSAAELDTGARCGNISRACSGVYKTAGGYKWEYAEKAVETDLSDFSPIPGYENYLISRNGKVYSLKSKRIMKHCIQGGYANVKIRKDNQNNSFGVHRLVAYVFIPNPENKLIVNHINSDRSDNRVENLEWVTHSENNLHASSMGRSNARAIVQLDMKENFIRSFKSIIEASTEYNLDPSSVVKCCKGKRKNAGGYKWMYKDED